MSGVWLCAGREWNEKFDFVKFRARMHAPNRIVIDVVVGGDKNTFPVPAYEFDPTLMSRYTFMWEGTIRDLPEALATSHRPDWLSNQQYQSIELLTYLPKPERILMERPQIAIGLMITSWLHAKVTFQNVPDAARNFMKMVKDAWQPHVMRRNLQGALVLEPTPEMGVDVATNDLVHAAVFASMIPAVGYQNYISDDTHGMDWNGLKLRGQALDMYSHAMTIATGGALRQSELDYLQCADLPLSGSLELFSQKLRTWQLGFGDMADEARDLATAFIAQLVREAKAAKRPPYCGTFWLRWSIDDESAPLDHLRVIIRPEGIWLSIVHNSDLAECSIGYWTPDEDNLIIQFSEKHAWIARIIAASIWRDATIVRERTFTRAEGREIRSPGKVKGERVIVLPRTIQRVQWGTETDRDIVRETIIRSPYNVQGYYRPLPTGQKRSEQAEVNAENERRPLPPDGWTFVKSYTVKGGVPEQERPRVVCRGLITAMTMLDKLKGSK